MAALRFVEHRSDRLHLQVRGADHPCLPQPRHASARQVAAGLYVTVLIRGDIELRIDERLIAPHSLGMLVAAVRQPMPWRASPTASAMRAVGVTMLRPDLRARGLEGWFDSLFARHEHQRQVQLAADARSLQLAEEILDSDPRQPLSLLRLEAAAQSIFVRGITALTQARPSPRRERLLHLADTLQADLGRAWSLAAMAQIAGMSARSLSQCFGQEFGLPPMHWLRRQRLLQGRDLVQAGAPISAAAAQLGFSSAAHFSTAFRTMFGKPPSECKKAADNPLARPQAAP